MESDRRCDLLLRNARLATCRGGEGLGLVESGAVAARDGRIVFAGPQSDLPPGIEATSVLDCGGRLVTPGLIDCHTHLVHAGSRAAEFKMRLEGATYEAIARAGGGILSTVGATRAACEADLLRESLPRLDALIAEGVTTVEIKSGYGLDLETERRQLRVAGKLSGIRAVSVTATYLGAHAVPPEFTGRREAYLDDIIDKILPALVAEGLVDAVDAFCETIAFSPEEVARLFEGAKALGLQVKLHAEQLSNQGGAALAASFGAVSADHLEYLDEAGVASMARAGTVAVLLPFAFYFLRERQVPPVEALRRADVPIALATDCNPGSSPVTSILLVLNMGATLFGLRVEECLLGVTRHAARALGFRDRGTIEPGAWCDLAVWDIDEPAELVYRAGFNPLHRRIWRGRCEASH